MRRSRILSAVLLTLTFLLGMGVGMLVDLPALSDTGSEKDREDGRPRDERRGRRHSHRERRAKFREKLIADLELTDKQVEQFDEIMAKQAGEYKELREQMKPMFVKFGKVRQSTRDQIRAILTETQLVKFNQKIKELDQKIKELDEKRKQYLERRKAKRKKAEKSSTTAHDKANPTDPKAMKPGGNQE